MLPFDTFSQKMSFYTENKGPNNKYRGPLILFEGVDLSGKSTIIKEVSKIYGHNSRIIAEPTKRSSLREMIFESHSLFDDEDSYNSAKNYINYYLIMASRAYSTLLCFEEIAKKNIVFLDRSFVSTLVYQEDIFTIDKIIRDNMLLFCELSMKFNFFDKILAPDIIFFLDISWETYATRVDRLLVERNSFDSDCKLIVEKRIASFRKVFDYLIRSQILGSKIVIIDANSSISESTSLVAKNLLYFLR